MHRLPIFSRSDELIGRVADQHVDVAGLAALDDALLLIGEANRPSTHGPQLTIIDQSSSRPLSGGTGRDSAASNTVRRIARACSSVETPNASEQTDSVGLRMLSYVLLWQLP